MASTNRFRTLALRIAIPALLGPALCGAVRAPAQYADNLVSEHIVVRIAREREWIGRDTVPDLERCWQFIERAIAGKLPHRVFVAPDWRRPLAWTRAVEDTVFIGMDDPAAVADPRGYLLFHAAREMARMALSKLSGSGAAREENAFLVEGMIEIYAHEFRGSARGIEAAWTLSHLLERTEGLGLNRMYRWQEYSAGRRDPCVTGPAVTFLLVCRQRHGREKLLRLFEALRRATPAEAFRQVLQTTAVELEQAWLEEVRRHDAGRELLAGAGADAPALRRAAADPERARAGETVRVQVSVTRGRAPLLPCGLFVTDLQSDRVFRARPAGAEGDYLAEIPVAAGSAPGHRTLRITAVDAAGNVRHWSGGYEIVP